MKKVMILLFGIALIMSFSVNAQDHSKTLKSSAYYYEFSFTSSDYVEASDTYYVQVTSRKLEPLKYSIKVEMDSISGDPQVAVSIQGKVFTGDSWTNISTTTWMGTASDTSFILSEISTAKYYRYWRVYFVATGTAQKATITKCDWRFWDK
jgi:hypothetical protein